MSDWSQQSGFANWLEEAGERTPVGGVDPARAGVHRNTFVGTLCEALAESFPVTCALAGSEFFHAMARERVLADPPRSPVLTEYAISFPGFVHCFGPAAATPVLAEMAQLEALRLRAFHAADADAVGLEQFHRLACDAALLSRTRVRLHPGSHWMPARHPLLELWQLHDAAADPSAVDLGGIDAARAQDVLVQRPRYAVLMQALPPGAIAFLDALASGCTLETAFVEAAASSKLAEPAALFSLLLQSGLVIELIEIPMEFA
ncbi:MAG: DNA-binding domain-containing protein [Arenimonas sp.]